MSQHSTEAWYIEQKKNRPKFEDVASDFIKGENLNNALNFIAWLRLNKRAPSWVSPNSWKINYKGKGLCYIKLHCQETDNAYWSICSTQSDVLIHDNFDLDEHSKMIWDKLKYCTGCCSCRPGYKKTVCGKEITNLCAWFFVVDNPCIEEIECVKEIIKISTNI